MAGKDGDLGDVLGGIFGTAGPGAPRTPAFSRQEEKGLPWEAKIINGEYYVPFRQVAELLKQNDVLPKVREGIDRRVAQGPPK